MVQFYCCDDEGVFYAAFGCTMWAQKERGFYCLIVQKNMPKDCAKGFISPSHIFPFFWKKEKNCREFEGELQDILRYIPSKGFHKLFSLKIMEILQS